MATDATEQTKTILVVEDDPNARMALSKFLELNEYHIVSADSASVAKDFLREPVDLVLSDLRLGAESGMDLLRLWKQHHPRIPFIMMTAHGEVESAVEAMKLGAQNYLLKPVNPDELLLHIQRSLEGLRKDTIIENLSERLDAKFGFEKLVGQSKIMMDVFDRVRRAARSDSTILILGESGTGKELLAEAVHQNSSRKDGPYVAVNMAAVPETLVESELFGHMKGSFTGATGNRTGRFQAAQNGTIFIDEIGDFALESQAKLLRVLEARTITPVGANREEDVNARVVAATSRNLEQMVSGGTFRDDLYYRLSVVTIPLPPLRERSEDVPLLVRYFLDTLCKAANRPPASISPELGRFLETFSWPGNVRQLRNCLESMVVMSEQSELALDDLPASIHPTSRRSEEGVQIPHELSLEQLEKLAITQALERSRGNRTHAARALGISVRTLQRKLHAWEHGSAEVVEQPIASHC